MKQVTIETLSYLKQIIEGKSAGEIAAENYAEKTTVTSRINRLQRDLGIELFDRKPGGKWQPNSQAKTILPHLNAILREYDLLLHALEDIPERPLRISAVPYQITWIIGRFLNVSPLSEIPEKVEMKISEMEGQLLSGNIDAAMIINPVHLDQYHALLIADLAVKAVVDADHPFAGNKVITTQMMENCRLLCGLDIAQYAEKLKSDRPEFSRTLSFASFHMLPDRILPMLHSEQNDILLTAASEMIQLSESFHVLPTDLPDCRIYFCCMKQMQDDPRIVRFFDHIRMGQKKDPQRVQH